MVSRRASTPSPHNAARRNGCARSSSSADRPCEAIRRDHGFVVPTIERGAVLFVRAGSKRRVHALLRTDLSASSNATNRRFRWRGGCGSARCTPEANREATASTVLASAVGAQ